MGRAWDRSNLPFACNDTGVKAMKEAVALLAKLMPAKDGGGNRLNGTFDGTGVKMAVWAAMAGPPGV